MLGTVHEIIGVDDTTRVVVYYDDDYQIEAEERELSPEEVKAEQTQIDLEGVYGVSVQKAQTWALLASDGAPTSATRTEWEDVESVWGCFLDDKYTAMDVARDHFDF